MWIIILSSVGVPFVLGAICLSALGYDANTIGLALIAGGALGIVFGWVLRQIFGNDYDFNKR